MAVDMATEGLIDRTEAVRRIAPESQTSCCTRPSIRPRNAR